MFRSFLILMTGSVSGQILSVAAVPLLSRLYTPAAFGMLGAVMAVVSLTTVLLHGRYHTAIPVADTHEDAVALLVLSVIASTLFAVPVTLVIFSVAGDRVAGFTAAALVGIAALIAFLSALIEILAYWRSYRRRFAVTARNQVARAASTVAGQISLYRYGAGGLVSGAVIGVTAGALLAVVDLLRHDRSSLRWPAHRALRAVAIRYRSYPLFGVPQGWVAALSWNAMPLLLLRFGGAAIAGQYWVAYRLLVAPLALFNGAYRQATLPVLRDLSMKDARRLARRHTLILIGLGLPVLILIQLFGDQIITLLLGSKWREAGILFSWMAVGVLADVFKIPALSLLQSLHRQRTILIWECGIVLMRYAAVLPFMLEGRLVEAVALFACLGFVSWAVFALYHLKKISILEKSE